MRSCHNAATEFLRQYWSAVLPTAAGALGAGTNATSAAVKSAKAEKMAGYLRSTDNKVNAVVHTATIAGFDPARVRAVSQEHRVCAKDGSLMDRLLRRLLGRCMSRWKGRSGGWRTARRRRAAGADYMHVVTAGVGHRKDVVHADSFTHYTPPKAWQAYFRRHRGIG